MKQRTIVFDEYNRNLITSLQFFYIHVQAFVES